MLEKNVTLVTTTVFGITVDTFNIVATEGCTQEDEKVIIDKFISIATDKRNGGGWSATSKARPGSCSLRFINGSEVFKRKLVEAAGRYYREVKEV